MIYGARGISGKVLADTLRALERDGLIRRQAYDETPPRVEYELTDLGSTLTVPLRALGDGAEEHFGDVADARERYDSRTDDALLAASSVRER